ncbi:MAG: tRNA pseudouridine(54/55) synthase Pus10 [Promethearchaeota archaeon]
MSDTPEDFGTDSEKEESKEIQNQEIEEKKREGEEKEEEEEIIVEIIPATLSIPQKTIDILKQYSICDECLGRQFSYLGTATDNSKRASAILLSLTMETHAALKAETVQKKFTLFEYTPQELLEIIALQAKFYPALKSLQDYYAKYEDTNKINELKENWEKHDCDLCQNILKQYSINKICSEIEDEVAEYDFNNFLIGTYLNPIITNKEEDIRAKIGIANGESFKANLNRLVGKELQIRFNKPTIFQKPDLQVMIDLRENISPTYELQPKALYLESKYKKFTRELPQTHWHCPECRGKGIHYKTHEICKACQGTGDMYASSIEDLIGEQILYHTYGEKALLHGAGREDLDARCLGSGRPFIMEVKKPQKRQIDLDKLQTSINSKYGTQIHVEKFSISSKKAIVNYKKNSEFSEKSYNALAYLGQPISMQFFIEKLKIVQSEMVNKVIHQRTPLRVVHRRADKTREKKIFEISGKYVDSRHIFFRIRAQGGTYIKELISSDNFRTSPSIAGIFDFPMICVELDVINIQKA